MTGVESRLRPAAKSAKPGRCHEIAARLAGRHIGGTVDADVSHSGFAVARLQPRR